MSEDLKPSGDITTKLIKKNIKITEWDPKKINTGRLSENSLFVWPHYFKSEVLCGHPNPENSETVLSSLNSAIDGCKEKIFKGMVTAPVNKAVINQAEYQFSGHTEFIANNTDTETPVMMLTTDKFRVALATTHIPLNQVSSSINKEKIINTVEIIHNDLKKYFKYSHLSLINVSSHLPILEKFHPAQNKNPSCSARLLISLQNFQYSYKT